MFFIPQVINFFGHIIITLYVSSNINVVSVKSALS
jgi:hypothetical protein